MCGFGVLQGPCDHVLSIKSVLGQGQGQGQGQVKVGVMLMDIIRSRVMVIVVVKVTCLSSETDPSNQRQIFLYPVPNLTPLHFPWTH